MLNYDTMADCPAIHQCYQPPAPFLRSRYELKESVEQPEAGCSYLIALGMSVFLFEVEVSQELMQEVAASEH